MSDLKYPIGIQTFSKIREGGWAYVDKTRFIASLVDGSQFIFLSRPRRFGKSLFLSTLEAYFEGRRALFKGLALDAEEVDWSPFPVLYFDFNTENYALENGLELRLDSCLRYYEQIYGRDLADTTPAQRFEAVIRNSYARTGKEVVILIDEYDKPLLALEENEGLFEKNQQILKSFFGNLKSMDRYIRFAFITGVARFNKVSIFSDLNNLKDITLDDRYADICGWTEDELIATFESGIRKLAERRGEDFDSTLELLRNYYDGYLFSPSGSRLYNPFSVLRALDSLSLEPFWFESATPTFLVRRMRAALVDPGEINGRMCTRNDLMKVRLDSRDPLPLMFQTGYLTIDSYDPVRQRYTLRFPNREVELAFAEDLLPLYVKDVKNPNSAFSLFNFQDDLFDGRPEAFMDRLSVLFKDMPYEDRSEAVYRAVTYLICKICSLDVRAESHSYKGRSDIEVLTGDYIYIFEFKYERSAKEALRQLYERDYHGRYSLDSRKIFLIGVNFNNSKDSGILTYEIQNL